MLAQERCQGCGNLIPAGNLRKICPVCLLRAGFPSDDNVRIERPLDDSDLPHHPPPIPDRNESPDPEVMGTMIAGASTLSRLSRTLGPVPQVLLQETDDGTGPPNIRPTPAPPANPDRRYQILGEIARGGMGAIIKGRDVDLGRDLAFKVLLEHHRHQPELVRRFIEEAQIGGQLQHPGIVPIYELGAFSDSRPYFTMKLVKGHTLAELLARRATPADDLPRVLGIFEQICQTVAYAHARGVIHRDLKPANVMVGNFGEVQVMDWGLAKVLHHDRLADDPTSSEMKDAEAIVTTVRQEDDSDLSTAGSIMGTPSYMAPEQARGEVSSLDERADVFALGSILCEVLTGSPPYSGPSSIEIQRRATRGDTAEALSRLDSSGAEPDLIALTRSCLALDPDDRPRDARAVSDHVTAYLNGVQQRLRTAERERAVAEARTLEERKRRRLQLGLAASVLALTTLGGLSFTYALHQRQAQASRVDRLLAEATLLRDQALEEPSDLTHWQRARDAIARLTDDLNSSSNPSIIALLDEIDTGLAAALADRRLLAELEFVRGDRGDGHVGLYQTDANYAAAFRKAGLEFDSAESVEAAARWILSRSEPEELCAYLDDWAYVRRRAIQTGVDDWRQLVAIARAADPDPWRDAMRAGLGASDEALLVQLRRLANDDREQDAQSPASLILLARELEALATVDDHNMAAQVLRRAASRHPNDFWVQFELARFTDLLGNDGAVRHLTAAIAIRPESASAHENLGRALRNLGRLQEAEFEYREALRLKPDSSWVQISLYEILAELGTLDVEVAACREAVRRDPNDPWARARLAGTLKARKDYDEAAAEFREAIRLKPEMLLAHVELGGCLWNLGKLDEALTPWSEAIRLNPDDHMMHLNLGMALLELGREDEAINAYREAQRLAPNDQLASMRIGEILMRQQKYDEAIDALRMQPKMPPYHSGANYRIGEILMLQEKYEEAIDAFQETIRISPDSLMVFSKLGTALKSLGRDDDVVDAFREALGPHLTTATAQRSLASALSMEGKYAEAIDAYREATRLNPEDVISHHNLAVLLQGQNRYDEAADSYRIALQFAPNKAHSHRGLGSVLERQGKLDEAIDSYREAIQLDPDYVGYYESLGLALIRRRKFDQALDTFHRAVQLDPQNAKIHYYVGMTCRSMFRGPEAATAFREAIRLDPTIPGIYFNLGIALGLQGKVAEAIEAFGEAIRQNSTTNTRTNTPLGIDLRKLSRCVEVFAAFRTAIRRDTQRVTDIRNPEDERGELSPDDESIRTGREPVDLDHSSIM